VSWFRFIAAEQAHHSVAVLCRVLHVSRSGCSAWLGRELSARARADAALTERIAAIHRERRET
jgi:putative transposase